MTLTLMIWRTFVVAFAVAIGYRDARTNRIPAGWAVAGLVLGLAVNAALGTFATALVAAAVAFAISAGLFWLGAMGGGDVKLITALAAMLGLKSWADAMYIAVIVAALMAVIQVVRRKAIRQTISNMAALLRHFVTAGPKPHPTLQVANESTLRTPFGVAAAVGTVCEVMRMMRG